MPFVSAGFDYKSAVHFGDFYGYSFSVVQECMLEVFYHLGLLTGQGSSIFLRSLACLHCSFWG
ncbi:hypothetical protein FH972_019047 [Carpinus fangiana]|uniref:Uncharacterized protein n=1 Tax=Carpinus fangiana TaxID=176857 RepID=A0A5N6RR56_9ROSI|nr:hypothetical protein FH972_019047 [Carpinus fangiana]